VKCFLGGERGGARKVRVYLLWFEPVLLSMGGRGFGDGVGRGGGSGVWMEV